MPSNHARVSERSRSALLAAAVVAAAMASLLTVRSTVVMAANPSPPFHQCPAVGVDTGCAILIVIQPDGSLTILSDATQRPFDNGDDTLLGVVNNSGIAVASIAIGSSTQAVFGFEAPGPDGLCAFVFVGDAYCTAVPRPTTGYEGPTSTFSGISANKRDGTVRFTGTGGGLQAGASTFFSLESAINASRFGTGAATSLVFAPASATTGDVADTVTVAATLTNGATPLVNAPVTFTLAPGATPVSCTATSDASGVASCALTPVEPAGVYQLIASYAGSSVPFLAPVNTSTPFTVTLEQDALAYTGAASATAGKPLVLSAALTTDDPSAGTRLSGRTITLSLTGVGAQTCTAVTDSSGSASCTVMVSRSSSPGRRVTSATFASDGSYQAVATAGTVVIAPAVTTPEVGVWHGIPWLAALLLTVLGTVLAATARRRR